MERCRPVRRHCKDNTQDQDNESPCEINVSNYCVKKDDYTSLDYLQYGEDGRVVGSWITRFETIPIFGGSRDSILAFNPAGTWTLGSTIIYPNKDVALRNIFQGEWWITARTENTIRIGGIGQVYFYDELGRPTVFQVLKFDLILTKNNENALYDAAVADATISVYNLLFVDDDPKKSVIGQQFVGSIEFPGSKLSRLLTTEQQLATQTLYNGCNKETCVDSKSKCSKHKCQKHKEIPYIKNISARCVKKDGYTTLDYTQHGDESRAIGVYVQRTLFPDGFRDGVFAVNAGGTVTVSSAFVNPDPRVQLRNVFQGEWLVTGSDANTITTTGFGQVYFYNKAGQPIQIQCYKATTVLTKNHENPLYDTIASQSVVSLYQFTFVGNDPSKSITGQTLLATIQNTSQGVRLAASPQALALKDIYNNCDCENSRNKACTAITNFPNHCVKKDTYSVLNYLQHGKQQRPRGAWLIKYTAPPELGGTREDVVAINLGGTWTMSSTILNSDPTANLRNVYQGEWWVTSCNKCSITITGAGQVYFYNNIGQVVQFQAIKFQAVLGKNCYNALYDSVTATAQITAYKFIFFEDNPANSVIGQKIIGITEISDISGIRLATAPQFLALKNYSNNCDPCN
jgi:hypothetical protein